MIQRNLRAAKVSPIWSGEQPRVLNEDALKRIIEMFCVEKEKTVCKSTILHEVKVEPLGFGDARRKRSKNELAVIAALFCVESEEDALLRRLRKHIVDFDGQQGARKEARSCGNNTHKHESTLVSIVEEDKGMIESEERRDDTCLMKKRQKKKKTNPFIKIYRFIRRTIFKK